MARKPMHPIRLMVKGLGRILGPSAQLTSAQRQERTIARHVKPLLDALEAQHAGNMIGRQRQANHEIVCEVCQLLAAWRAKL